MSEASPESVVADLLWTLGNALMALAQDRLQAISAANADALAAESRDPGWVTAADSLKALVISQEALIESVRRIEARLDDVVATLAADRGNAGN